MTPNRLHSVASVAHLWFGFSASKVLSSRLGAILPTSPFLLFGTPFDIEKHPQSFFQYTILSNDWGAVRAGQLFYAADDESACMLRTILRKRMRNSVIVVIAARKSEIGSARKTANN